MTNVIEKVKAALLEDVGVLKEIVRELNAWDGSFENLDVHENDEDFFHTYFEGRPMEAVRAAHYGDYSFSDNYVRFDGYENLESLSEYQYEQEIKDEVDEIIDAMIEKRQHIYLDPDIEELLDEEEEDEE